MLFYLDSFIRPNVELRLIIILHLLTLVLTLTFLIKYFTKNKNESPITTRHNYYMQ